MDLGIDGLGDASEIGIGASAIVYRAAQQGLQREVAIKVLVASDDEFVRRFEREAVLLARLSRSPQIVTVHDTGVTRTGQPYLVMQLCRGSLLDRIKDEGTIDPAEAGRIMAGVAAGVADAHALQVIHRDLKPGNILISPEGEYLVTDFGTSIVTGATTLQTSSISFTAGYVAPETVTDSTPSSYPVDVYALGATLFHMVSGSPPFLNTSVDSNIVALATRVVNDPVPDLRPLGVPDALCRLIEWTMAKDPAARPTIEQFGDELGAFGRLAASADASSPTLVASADASSPTLAASADASSPTLAASADAPSPTLAASGAAVSAGVSRLEGLDGVAETWSMGPGRGAPASEMPGSEMAPIRGSILGDGAVPPSGGPEEPPVLWSEPAASTAPSASAPWWTAVSDSFLRRLRLRHVLVAVSGLLVLGLAIGAAVGFLGGGDGGVDLASEVAGPVVAGAGDVADGAVNAGTGSAAGADSAGRQVADLLEANDEEATSPVVEPDPTPEPDPAPDPSPRPDPNEGTVVVPSVAGLTQAEALAALAAAGLVAGETSLVFSPTVAAGLVVELSESGRVDDGTVVDLVLSRGPAVSLPDLLALTEAQAVEQLGVLGLTATITIIEGSGAPPGSVVSMDPGPGTDVEQGSAVSLGIAAEILPVVPNLVGTRVGPARTLLAEAGLELGEISRIHDAQPVGLILSSTPTTGASVAAGSAVDVVVSLGPEPDPCDGVVGQVAQAARAALEAAGLSVQLVQDFSEVHPLGTVMACQHVSSSDEVTLTVSQGAFNPVPDVVGLIRGRAQATLQAAGMDYSVSRVFSTERVGIVIATDPSAGSHYVAGTSVALVVSKGLDPDPENPDTATLR